MSVVPVPFMSAKRTVVVGFFSGVPEMAWGASNRPAPNARA